jgi:hypothetical protein
MISCGVDATRRESQNNNERTQVPAQVVLNGGEDRWQRSAHPNPRRPAPGDLPIPMACITAARLWVRRKQVSNWSGNRLQAHMKGFVRQEMSGNNTSRRFETH